MSARMVALVERAFIVGVHGDDELKAVLLALAHHADDDGNVTVSGVDPDQRNRDALTAFRLNIERMVGAPPNRAERRRRNRKGG